MGSQPCTASYTAASLATQAGYYEEFDFADVFAHLKPAFESVAMAKVSTSAFEAKALKLARESDVVTFNSHELLHVAKANARALAEGGV